MFNNFVRVNVRPKCKIEKILKILLGADGRYDDAKISIMRQSPQKMFGDFVFLFEFYFGIELDLFNKYVSLWYL